MTASRWLSDTLRRLNARERIVVAGGAVVSAAAIGIVLLVLPFARRWSARESAISASSEQWIRLQALTADEALLKRTLDTLRRSQQSVGTRLITGTTPAVAASNLQVLLQRYADESAVQLDRVDAAQEPGTSESGLIRVPMRLQGHGDIYGLVDFLYRLQHGEKLLVLDELSANAGLESTAGTQSLTWSIRLHALYPATAPQQRGAGS